MRAIKTVKIHPAIGIARLGNSPSGFFVGPELPGDSRPPKGGYKDAQGWVKRQAARFRVFGYDASGKLVKEITARDAAITWTVHLANKKAAWNRFDGPKRNTPLRNAGVTDRTSLIIDPGPRSLTGPDQAATFDSGTFLGAIVPLGGVRTEPTGRLLVLGGFGDSRSPKNKPIVHWANNDGWHDDMSDGPVTATVTLRKTGDTLNAAGAWVICPPPDFAPPLASVTTLYDALIQTAVDRLGFKLPIKPSFTRDIYPILVRAIRMKWVSMVVAKAGAHSTFDAVMSPPGDPAVRAAIFDRLRDPTTPPGAKSEGDMPMLWSDHYPKKGVEPLTRVQYATMEKWRDGKFIGDWKGPPKPARTVTPDGLDRAALCPGIEAGWLLRDDYAFVEPFRLDHSNRFAGDVTKQMAVPWQADFADCTHEGSLAWWPAQRPDGVFPEAGGPQVPWTRDLISAPKDMVANWHRLGFVVKKGAKFVETERNP